MEYPFKDTRIKTSQYPRDFIPKGAEVFVGIDHRSPDGESTVKGFYDPQTGEFHIQEVTHNLKANRGGDDGK